MVTEKGMHITFGLALWRLDVGAISSSSLFIGSSSLKFINLAVVGTIKLISLIGFNCGLKEHRIPPQRQAVTLQAMPLDNFRFITVRQKLLCFIGKT